jgi:hypothetical protein
VKLSRLGSLCVALIAFWAKIVVPKCVELCAAAQCRLSDDLRAISFDSQSASTEAEIHLDPFSAGAKPVGLAVVN